MNGKVNVYIKNVDVIIIDVTRLCWSSLEVVIQLVKVIFDTFIKHNNVAKTLLTQMML